MNIGKRLWLKKGILGSLIFALVFLIPFVAPAQATETSSISGTISYEGMETGPIGVMVREYPSITGPEVAFTTISAPSSYSVTGLPEGIYTVCAGMDIDGDELYGEQGEPLGAYGTFDPVTVTAGQDTPNIDITLKDPGSISGTISYTGTQTGKIYGVSFFDPSLTGPSTPPFPISNAPGSYYFIDCPSGTFYITAFMDSNGNGEYDDTEPYGIHGAPDPVTVSPNEETPNINILLIDPGSTGISGTVTSEVTEESGTTAYVLVWPAGSEPGIENGPVAGAVVTIGSGTYTITNTFDESPLPPATYDVYAATGEIPEEGPPSNLVIRGARENVTVNSDEITPNINFTLQEGGTLQGTVTDSSTGTAISGVQILVYDSSDSMVAYATTDASGDYSLLQVPEGNYTVEAEASGYQSSSPESVSITVGGTTTQDITLSSIPPYTIPTASITLDGDPTDWYRGR